MIKQENLNLIIKRAFHLTSAGHRPWGTKIAFNTRFHWMNLKKIMGERASFPFGALITQLLIMIIVYFNYIIIFGMNSSATSFFYNSG